MELTALIGYRAIRAYAYKAKIVNKDSPIVCDILHWKFNRASVHSLWVFCY